MSISAITTKYMGPTNTKGSRVKAYKSGDPKFFCYFSYRSELDSEFNHQLAASKLCSLANWPWKRFASFATTDGFVHVPVELDNGQEPCLAYSVTTEVCRKHLGEM